MSNEEVKGLRENVEALVKNGDEALVRQVDAYFSGVLAGYELARKEAEENGQNTSDS